MGMSTFGSYEIARSGMMAYNAAIQTTAHNVANIETKGYSRQVANMTSMVNNRNGYKVQGAGVCITDIARQRDEYYDLKFQTTQSAFSQYDTEEVYLEEMQSILAGGIVDDSDNQALITNAFDKFNATLSDLVGKPNDSTIRRQCVTTAQTFTEFINNVGTKLQQLQEQANTQINTCVQQINAYAEKIVSLTKQINTIETYGSTANDLRDQRTTMIDELSQYCNVETLEVEPEDGVGDNQFYVYVNGGVLVDTYHVNELVAVQKDTYSNINDITGCYDLKWADGTDFPEHSTALGGQLQALFEIRDGNNGITLQGAIQTASMAKPATATTPAEPAKIILTDTNCNDVNKLNIPSSDGEITVAGHTYTYDRFYVAVNQTTGAFTYTFELKGDLTTAQQSAIANAAAGQYTATVGEAVDFRGIPYYVAQINEFVRTYAEQFNMIQNGGYDGYSQADGCSDGIDFFNATVPTTGDNYVMEEKIQITPQNGASYWVDPAFSSVPGKKNADGSYAGSYYYMTIMNFGVTRAIDEDPTLIAAKGDIADGSDNADNLQKLTELKDDADMFVYGAPDSFIQAFTSTVGVDCRKSTSLAESQSNLLYMVDSSRKSISGVDEDEEGADLLIFRQMLYNQYKVLSVMTEVLDKLINETAV